VQDAAPVAESHALAELVHQDLHARHQPPYRSIKNRWDIQTNTWRARSGKRTPKDRNR
jgi:hypothetical protein